MCEIDSIDLFDTKDEGALGELRWTLFEVKQPLRFLKNARILPGRYPSDGAIHPAFP
tara:strand:+ start:319 stop:489 length:171 start_codon:yes stop_codon:yes gene_type:complete